MLESLFSFKSLDKRPYLIIIWSVIISIVAIVLSFSLPVYKIYGLSGPNVDVRGLFAVIFTVIPAAYFVTRYIRREEREEEKFIEGKYRKGIWYRHGKDIFIFILYFFSVALTFSVASFFLPDTFFQIQKLELVRITSESPAILTGNLLTGSLTAPQNFIIILFNNLNITLFSFVIGLLFGAGAIFILTWNAGLLATKIAIQAQTISNVPLVTTTFLAHGVLEIGAYVLAGLAGSIISAAVLRGHHKRGVMRRIILDSVYVLVLAVIFVFVAAYIEAFWVLG